MKINQTCINRNLKVYYEVREILPIIQEYEKGLVNHGAMRSLGLGNFSEFSDFLKETQEKGFDPVMADMSWRKLKLLLVSNTQNKRFQGFISNRTQNQFRNLLSDGATFDRLLNGRWIRKPKYTKRGRKTYGSRDNQKLEGLEYCLVPILNYIIQTEADVYEDTTIQYEAFPLQYAYSNKVKWYTNEVLNFEKVPKREIEVTRNLLTNLVDFIDETRIDFRKLNFDYLNSVITDKIRKLMQVPNGTMLKCIKDSKFNQTSYLTVGNTYEVKGTSMSNGYVKVLVFNDRGTTEWYEYSHFEDISIQRDDILSKLFE